MNKYMAQESLLGALADYYKDNPKAMEYIDKNIPTPADVDVFVRDQNISINYQAPNMSVATESFIQVINKNLKRMRD